MTDPDLLERVVASFASAPDARFRELMESLVRHLHAFAEDIRLTEVEWDTAIRFLTETGQTCSGSRQEFILLSDVLGLSMQVVGLNAAVSAGATESTVFGPFFLEDSPAIDLGGDLAVGVSGARCHLSGTVVDGAGRPLPGARVEIWEADDDGFYDVQYDGAPCRGRGHLFTDDQGRYDVWAVLPAAYPIPDDGPVGRLLAAGGRSPMRPAHVHFMVSAPEQRTLITHVFVSTSDHLDSDAVFGVKQALIVDFAEHEPGTGPGGRELLDTWYSARFDIVLADRVEAEP